MTTLAREVPAVQPSARGDLPEQAAGRLSPAQGAAMGEIRTVIFQRDSGRRFADIRRVLTAAGDYLWICPDHYGDYDPGLPSIPSSLC
jgi:internalin A